MSQSGLLDIVSSTPSVPTQFDADTGSAVPIANTLDILGGTGISTSASGMTVTVSAIAGSFIWSTVKDATQALAVENGYVGNLASAITYTLPATANVGDTIQITNIGAGLPVIAQNAGQSINFTASSTTVGVDGSLTSVNQFGSLELICVVQDTTFNVVDSIGSWVVV